MSGFRLNNTYEGSYVELFEILKNNYKKAEF